MSESFTKQLRPEFSSAFVEALAYIHSTPALQVKVQLFHHMRSNALVQMFVMKAHTTL